jgi:hypothetical protein
MQPEFITGATACMGPFLAVAFVTGLQRSFPRTNQYGPLQSRYRASSLAKPGRAVAINNLATRWGLSCKKRASKELAQGDKSPRPTNLILLHSSDAARLLRRPRTRRPVHRVVAPSHHPSSYVHRADHPGCWAPRGGSSDRDP